MAGALLRPALFPSILRRGSGNRNSLPLERACLFHLGLDAWSNAEVASGKPAKTKIHS
jgi:hypothetical protein